MFSTRRDSRGAQMRMGGAGGRVKWVGRGTANRKIDCWLEAIERE